MKTYKLTLTDASLALIAQYVAGLALIDEDKAAELLDEDGSPDVEATLAALTDPTPHFISRPLALLKAACGHAVIKGKVTAKAYAEVFPEAPAVERKPKAPRKPAAPPASEVDALAIPAPVKAAKVKKDKTAGKAGPKGAALPAAVRTFKEKAPKAVKLPDGAALVESLKTKTPHAAPVSQPDPASL